jgi:hypothetical protein
MKKNNVGRRSITTGDVNLGLGLRKVTTAGVALLQAMKFVVGVTLLSTSLPARGLIASFSNRFAPVYTKRLNELISTNEI